MMMINRGGYSATPRAESQFVLLEKGVPLSRMMVVVVARREGETMSSRVDTQAARARWLLCCRRLALSAQLETGRRLRVRSRALS